MTAAAVSVAAVPLSSAWAGPVSVTPTSITLLPGRATDLISLFNEGDTGARFEVTLAAWTESADGKTKLAPTQDLIAFPPLLEIAPHQTRNVRVGVTGAFAASERSYRLVVQELPSAVPSSAQVQIQVLTKISLPVFVTPEGTKAEARIEAPRLDQGMLTFTVFNPGTAHFVLHRIEVAGAGNTFQVGEAGWYVLAGARREYRVMLARTDCQKTNSITISADGGGPKAEAVLPITAAGCGRGAATRFVAAGQGQAPAAQ